MGSEMGVPLAGTRLLLWPLSVKKEKEHAAQAQIKQVSKRELAFDELYGQYYGRGLAPALAKALDRYGILSS
jgi:hypothetical protein